jgi:hypothetical protein
MAEHVLVLNASYEPLQRVSLRHAIKMLVREVAVIEEEAEGTFGPFPKPKVLRLVRYVVTRWRHRRGHLCTKSAVNSTTPYGSLATTKASSAKPTKRP